MHGLTLVTNYLSRVNKMGRLVQKEGLGVCGRDFNREEKIKLTYLVVSCSQQLP